MSDAIVRYHTLDRCFRNTGRMYQMKDLLNACNEALHEINNQHSGVQRRQLYDDIKFMESEAGYAVELEKKKIGRNTYYRYTDPNFSIKNQPINETEAQQIKEALMTLSRFKGMPQFEWMEELILRLESNFQLGNVTEQKIEFDQNPFLKGMNNFSELYKAVVYEQVLKINYQSYRMKEPVESLFHPQYLKQYNNRWFVLGITPDYTVLSCYAIDRLVSFESCPNIDFIKSTINFQEYFDDIIGVTFPENKKVEKILLKINTSLAPYIISKALHGTQKIKERDDSGILVELSVIVNYELTALLRSYGSSVEVLTPLHLKESILKDARKIVERS